MIKGSPRIAFAATAAAILLTWPANLVAQGPDSTDDAAAAAAEGVLHVTAVDYAFRAPDEIPSGWTTIRFHNDGEEHHFIFLSRLPDDRTFEEYEHEVFPPFAEVYDRLKAGEIGQEDVFPALGEALPEWFWGVGQAGGPGLTRPGGVSEATVMLEPGVYVLECYMKTAEGEFHAAEGMVRPIVVTEAATGVAAPAADARMTISNEGIELDRELTAGRHVIEVRFAEQPGEGPPHDVHLARLDDDGEVERVVAWMNWLDLEGMVEPAPATFIGGTHELPAGTTTYITVYVEPGRYLWVSEYTGAMGVLKEFTVAP